MVCNCSIAAILQYNCDQFYALCWHSILSANTHDYSLFYKREKKLVVVTLAQYKRQPFLPNMSMHVLAIFENSFKYIYVCVCN